MANKQRNNKEDLLQASIVLWFGQTWPEYQQLLFEVYNNPANEKHTMHRRAMGMKAGVADTLLIQPSTSICFGIEYKAPGESYSYNKIEHQIKWGVNLTNNGGGYIMSSDYELIKRFITAIINNDSDDIILCQLIANNFIQKQLEKRKTIKF